MAAPSAPATPQPSPEAAQFFEKNIRPLLAEQCYACHSSKTKVALGGLKVDSRTALLAGGKRGAAIMPGKPDDSLLLLAVKHAEKGLQMPPKGKLPEEKIALLEEWVKMGAPWPGDTGAGKTAPLKGAFDLKARARHWAFQPLKRPALPTVKNPAWARTPVDRFILAKLEATRLSPAKPADKRTLLRRVTFDLTGLPPTPAEVDAFLADTAPNAFEKVVDRLLASPQYGERWARHWLDLVRFAETDGHEFDFEKPSAWQYRDYVIRAFNQDVPYNQFVVEHMAGDLLPTPRTHPTERFNESVIGTGFFWLGEGKHSPVDLREDEAERVDNQIDVASKAFLGLSLGCARCHDHKFDAISQKDFYALAGYLRSSRFQLAAIDAPDRFRGPAGELENLQSDLQPLLAQYVQSRQRTVDGATLDEWLARSPEAAKVVEHPLHPWAVLAGQQPEQFAQRRDALVQRLRAQAERAAKSMQAAVPFEEFDKDTYGSWFVTGEAFGAGPSRSVALSVDAQKGARVNGLKPAGVADSGRLSNRLQGTLRSQTFTISKGKILFRMGGQDCQVNLIIDGFQRIRYPIYGGLTLPVNSGGRLTWQAMDVAKWIGHRAYIEILDHGRGSVAVDRILFADEAPVNAPNPQIVRMLEDPDVTTAEALARKYETVVRQALETAGSPGAEASPELADWVLRTDPLDVASVSASAQQTGTMATLLEKRAKLEEAIPDAQRVMAIVDGTPEDERVHIRGSHKTLGDVVPRRFLEAVAGPNQPKPATGSGRLELAQRMASATNPILPRVLVNRIWMHHFGEGIVRTPDDLGIRGERPTHPELLEFLTSEFVRNGWSMKKLHRMLVLSNTYQMSSQPEPKAEAKDPLNKLLHRMPVRRLEAEAIRDAVLAVSGRLDRKMYGPGVLPYLTPFMEGRGRPASSGPTDGAGRRSLYINVRRNFLTPMFLAFDYPIPFNTMGRRSVSTVPAQALTMMNNPFVVEQAGVWAKQTLSEPNLELRERIRRMYVTAFARPPADAELQAAAGFLAEQDGKYGAANDPRSWSDLAHVLLNVKEFIFVN